MQSRAASENTSHPTLIIFKHYKEHLDQVFFLYQFLSKMCCISLFQKDREGRSENLGGPEQPKRNKARKSQKEQERAKRPRKKPKRKRGQEEDESLKILEEENLAKVLQNLLSEIKKFNDEVEKIRLNDSREKDGKSPTKDFNEKIRAGRVLPPLLRTLQLLLQRPEAKIVVSIKRNTQYN